MIKVFYLRFEILRDVKSSLKVRILGSLRSSRYVKFLNWV